VLHPLPNGRRALSHTCWMGAAAHEVVDDLAQGLPRRVSSPAERLKGARSTPAAQHCEGCVPSGSERADPSCGGPGSRPGTVSLAHHCVWFGRTLRVQAPPPGSAAPVDREWCRDNRPCVGGDHGSYPTPLFEKPYLLAVESNPKPEKRLHLPARQPLIHLSCLFQAAAFSIMPPNET
jgi:hypothetical protein